MAYTDRFPIVKNFFETRLSVACGAGDSTLYLEGAENLPEFLAGRDYIPLVLRDAGTVREIVYAVAVDRAAGSVEVLRAQEGSTTNLWDVGTYVYCTMTADSLQKMRVNGFAPLLDGDNGRPVIRRTSVTTATLDGDYTDQMEVGMAVRVLAGDSVVAPKDASVGAIHLINVSYANGVTSLAFQNVTLPSTISGLDLGLSVASAPLYHPDTIVADEETLTQEGNVLSVSEAFRAAQADIDAAQDTAISDLAAIREDTVAAAQLAASMSQGESGSLTLEGVAAEVGIKANASLDNLSAAGRSLAAGLGMPSGRYVDLTLGASGITYTAPANGWFTLTKTAQSAGEMVGLIGWPYNQRIISFAQWASAWISCFMPVLAGQQVVAEYTATGATQYFRFIYAEGEEA